MPESHRSLPKDEFARRFRALTPAEEAELGLHDQPQPEQHHHGSERQQLLIEQAEQLNREFFGDHYDQLFPESIPLPEFSDPVWEYITQGEFHPYYLPDLVLPTIDAHTDLTTYLQTLNQTYPYWLLPQEWFFERVKEYITSGNQGVKPISLTLTGGWRWIESVPKPNYQQPYPTTAFMTNLAQSMPPSAPTLTDKLIQGNRVSVSWHEIMNPNGIADQASTLLNQSTRLPTLLEWNLMANLEVFITKHQKPDPREGWGATNIYEWLKDERPYADGHVHRLVAGHAGSGGLLLVYSGDPSGRSVYIGFRFLGVL